MTDDNIIRWCYFEDDLDKPITKELHISHTPDHAHDLCLIAEKVTEIITDIEVIMHKKHIQWITAGIEPLPVDLAQRKRL